MTACPEPRRRVHVTRHAVDRYIERVAPVPRDRAAEIILAASRGIEVAAAIGARIVRLPGGARLVCRGREHIRVVTVLPMGAIDGGREPRLAPLCPGVDR